MRRLFSLLDWRRPEIIGGMFRRWIIRSLFLVPLVCVVGLWVTSYWKCLEFSHIGRGIYESRTDWGRVFIFHMEAHSSPVGWHAWIGTPSPNWNFWFEMDSRVVPTYGHCISVWVPLWLPTLLLLGLNWFIWRTTRPKPKGRAFPITPDPASKTS